MTVTELIEALRAMPGEPDLRDVRTKVIVRRPYAPDATCEGRVVDTQAEMGEATLTTYIYIE